MRFFSSSSGEWRPRTILDKGVLAIPWPRGGSNQFTKENKRIWERVTHTGLRLISEHSKRISDNAPQVKKLKSKHWK
jgi:hypothetical protein